MSPKLFSFYSSLVFSFAVVLLCQDGFGSPPPLYLQPRIGNYAALQNKSIIQLRALDTPILLEFRTPPPPMTSSASSFAAFEDALDDVHSRFILNLPGNELSSADRIFFQLEQAHWYYEVRPVSCVPELSTMKGDMAWRPPLRHISQTKLRTVPPEWAAHRKLDWTPSLY